MAFNLQTFQKLMAVVQAATSEAASVAGQWGSGDHQGAVTTAVQTAGAIAQSATSNPQQQQEASSATQLASALLPTIFAFASLFAKKP
jgi:glucose-6-phosphate-specific signal transduction histidine kinase